MRQSKHGVHKLWHTFEQDKCLNLALPSNRNVPSFFFVNKLRCSCGNCSTEYLVNFNECHCWQEVEQCVEALNSQIVLEDTKITIGCITQHPGFAPLCLNKWVLRQAAGKYRRIDGRSYPIAGSEEA